MPNIDSLAHDSDQKTITPPASASAERPARRPMKKRLLLVILVVARALGLFRVSRWITRNKLRILAYHGGSIGNEHEFRSGLFMPESVFAQRMQHLQQARYPVLSLNSALSALYEGTLPACSTVITIDDGWYSTATSLVPVLSRHRFPATIYIASYYLQKQTMVFNVAIDYVLWLAGNRELHIADISPQLSGTYELQDPAQRTAATRALWTLADQLDNAEQREYLLQQACQCVQVDYQRLRGSRCMSYLSAAEAAELHRVGIDVQLHTHRHRFPSEGKEEAERELSCNRAALEGIASTPLRHFCYPSGEYSPHQLAWLPAMDVDSATTTQAGFNHADTHRYQLNRFLDNTQLDNIEFEAEMCGFFELIRYTGYRI